MESRHALAQLIDSIEAANGWSDVDVARQASAAGHAISKANISRIRLEPVVGIKASAVRALAAGLRVPERLVAMAALRSMGLDVGEPKVTSAAQAIRDDPRLDERGRRMLLALLSEITATKESGSSGDTAPTKVGTTAFTTRHGMDVVIGTVEDGDGDSPPRDGERRSGERRHGDRRART